MTNWESLATEMQHMLHLKTGPLALKRLEKDEDLVEVGKVYRFPHTFTLCQALYMARAYGLTVGITATDPMFDRCKRLHGLKEAPEDAMREEADWLSATWFGSSDDAFQQQLDSPREPRAAAIVLTPLSRSKFEPEVVLVFADPAQMVMLLCGLQKEKYERFQFFFIGEGACADSLGQCYKSHKPALALPCYGERAMGQVADNELLLALPAGEVERAVSGMLRLAKVGFRYPIASVGGQTDIKPIISRVYPSAFKS